MAVSRTMRIILIRLYLLLFVLAIFFFVLKEKLFIWFRGRSSESGMSVLTRGYILSQMSTKRLSNDIVITHFAPSSSNTIGDPIKVTLSACSKAKFLVLKNVPLDSFHSVLVDKFDALKEYLKQEAVDTYNVSHGTQAFDISMDDLQQPNLNMRRQFYSLIFALISDHHDIYTEKIGIACYVIHVKFRDEEKVNTSMMYAFWKTNWDRLLTPQILFAASHDSDSSKDPNQSNQNTECLLKISDNLKYENNKIRENDWRPWCFICLSNSSSELSFLLPCRHATVCSDCFETYQKNVLSSSSHYLFGLITCPLCRTPISSIVSLPSVKSDPLSTVEVD